MIGNIKNFFSISQFILKWALQYPLSIMRKLTYFRRSEICYIFKLVSLGKCIKNPHFSRKPGVNLAQKKRHPQFEIVSV